MMEDNKSQMPGAIFSGMLDNGSTYWCSHSVEGAAKIVGAKNATGYPETKYTRSDLVTELADALEAVLFQARGEIQGFSFSELNDQAKAALAKIGR